MTSTKHIYAQHFLETAVLLSFLQDHNSSAGFESPNAETASRYTFGSDPSDARRDAYIKFADSIAWILAHVPGVPVSAGLHVVPAPTPENPAEHRVTLVMGYPEPEFFKMSQFGLVFATILGNVRALSRGSIGRFEASSIILRHIIQMKTQKLARYSNKVWIAAGRLQLGYIREWIDRWLHDLQDGHTTGDFSRAERSLKNAPLLPGETGNPLRPEIDPSNEDIITVRRNMHKMLLAVQASECLVNFAETCPVIYSNSGSSEGQSLTIGRRIPFDVETDFSGGISRVLQRMADAETAQYLEAQLLENIPPLENFREKCEQHWNQSLVHNEMQFLGYFAKDGGKPLYDYVGSAKVPCWCCKTILQKFGIQSRGTPKRVNPGWVPPDDLNTQDMLVMRMKEVRGELDEEIVNQLERILGDECKMKDGTVVASDRG